jgi:hypothetical protein
MHELENEPYGLALLIVALRDYADAKAAVEAHERNPKHFELPAGDPMIELFQHTEFELAFGIARVAAETAEDDDSQRDGP